MRMAQIYVYMLKKNLIKYLTQNSYANEDLIKELQ